MTTRTYLFKSSRGPKMYKTVVRDNGAAITCDCPARVECWHIRRVREGDIIGRTELPPLSNDDRRMFLRLMDEGNTHGAVEFLSELFPSMSVEEAVDLSNGIDFAEEERDDEVAEES